MRYRLAVAAGYAAILGWLAHSPDNLAGWVIFSLLFIVPFVAGFGAGRWAVLALPLAVLLALSAGPGTGEEEIPAWLGMSFVALVALPVIVVGWGARWFETSYLSRLRDTP
jgi:hypothetical protein